MDPVIDIRRIHRVFETDAGFAHILHDVSLTVDPGEFVAITGPSGSGKSTLMNILGCLDTPSSGTYLLEGLDVARLTDDELAEVRAERIGFVFQSFNLLPRMSVLDNVMLPLAYTDCPRARREKRAVAALAAAGLPVDHFDHRISELSGGQMQRVAIARALVNDPAIILADEPTGNLDTATGRMVLESFHRLRDAGKTIVLITHDPGIAAEADRIVTIRDGRLHHEGTATGAAPAKPAPLDQKGGPR
ncbi:MAG: ABC transporter ATP-binding protein [Collinsella sp.]|nr:ABC transporter ATP-binding protein [Collinsella sp.]